MNKEAIYVGWPYARGQKRCKACGRYVDKNVIVSTKEDGFYVCNIRCGLRVVK